MSGKYRQHENTGESRFGKLGIDVSQAHGKLLAEATRIAAELECSLSQLALAWVWQSNHRIIPIVGASRLSQLQDNFGCLDITLSEAHFNELEAVNRPRLHEPYAVLNRPDQLKRMLGDFQHCIDK